MSHPGSGFELAALMPADWRGLLADELEQPYVRLLEIFLAQAYAQTCVYPAREQLFAALHATPLAAVKVLLLGQDPYHGEGQAHGLSFSVPSGTRLPPSLKNIFKELKADLGIDPPPSGDLSPWAAQGVLLLNAVLSVRAGEAASHKAQGWERFSDAIIRQLSRHHAGMVFVLWGNYAKQKSPLIDRSKHLLIEGVHPSPLSASRGFIGSRPFSAINQALERLGETPINWQL
ncbi:MAG: uracil-DNA glycosylase [Candidatus Melainabacteria bacterium HGW-Melainabacteria-1]|nr:MAG: uracil-DNA glycosylase [Candidatus Melainabacteria bacterium HGW-Melainabacteria-1]